MQAGKGAGYERWAKVYNLKQMAAASEHFHTLSEQMQQLESGMKTNAAIKAAIVDYALHGRGF